MYVVYEGSLKFEEDTEVFGEEVVDACPRFLGVEAAIGFVGFGSGSDICKRQHCTPLFLYVVFGLSTKHIHLTVQKFVDNENTDQYFFQIFLRKVAKTWQIKDRND